MNSIFTNKIYLITTLWSYPFGGGEEFMYDTMEYAFSLGMKSYWISFSNSYNKLFKELKITKHKYGTIINIPSGFNKESLQIWIKLLKPHIIHHQGNLRNDFYQVANFLKIPFFSGFHFWNGGIDLNPITYNSEILQNKKLHKISDDLKILLNSNQCVLYTASPFVKECFNKICNINIQDIIYPSSSVERYLIDKKEWIQNRKYITMINIHKLKGGELFFNLVKNNNEKNFLCIKTENGSQKLDLEIQKEMLKNPDNKYLERMDNIKEIYKLTKILLAPSIVDETFCRVVNEAMMNGIPVLSTHKGNIKYLLGNTTPILSINNHQDWEKEINFLLNNEDYYETVSKLMLERYKFFSENIAKKQFSNVIKKTLINSKNYNIAIFCPWYDQGLGIQSRNYYNILKNTNLFNVYIFSYKSYLNINSKNNAEWKIDDIYYSENNREQVTDIEILNFCDKYNIGKFIIPETCWFRIFEIALLLKNNNILCYGIPNIEIVRKDEIFKHNYFYKILANNKLCFNIFNKKNIKSKYIGYGIENSHLVQEKIFENNIIKFLFIGGMNAFSRKNLLDVCASFKQAYELNKNIYLTITIQKTNDLEINLVNKLNEYKNNFNITIIEEHLSYEEIKTLYLTHHINIQVSKHEGLGLGFYESINLGTPVITLNTPPHNEIIIDNINGWIIDCNFKEMIDNSDPLYGSAYFDTNDLANKIIEVSNKEVILKVIDSLYNDYKIRLNYETFKKRFINELL